MSAIADVFTDQASAVSTISSITPVGIVPHLVCNEGADLPATMLGHLGPLLGGAGGIASAIGGGPFGLASTLIGGSGATAVSAPVTTAIVDGIESFGSSISAPFVDPSARAGMAKFSAQQVAVSGSITPIAGWTAPPLAGDPYARCGLDGYLGGDDPYEWPDAQVAVCGWYGDHPQPPMQYGDAFGHGVAPDALPAWDDLAQRQGDLLTEFPDWQVGVSYSFGNGFDEHFVAQYCDDPGECGTPDYMEPVIDGDWLTAPDPFEPAPQEMWWGEDAPPAQWGTQMVFECGTVTEPGPPEFICGNELVDFDDDWGFDSDDDFGGGGAVSDTDRAIADLLGVDLPDDTEAAIDALLLRLAEQQLEAERALEDLSEELDELSDELDDLSDANDELADENRQLGDEVDDLNDDLDDLTAANDELDGLNQQLVDDLDEVNDALDELDTALDDLDSAQAGADGTYVDPVTGETIAVLVDDGTEGAGPDPSQFGGDGVDDATEGAGPDPSLFGGDGVEDEVDPLTGAPVPAGVGASDDLFGADPDPSQFGGDGQEDDLFGADPDPSQFGGDGQEDDLFGADPDPSQFGGDGQEDDLFAAPEDDLATAQPAAAPDPVETFNDTPPADDQY